MAIGIPYSTVSTIFTRGIGGTSIQTIVQICKALKIDVESLSDGKIVKKADDCLFPECQTVKKDLFIIRFNNTLIERNITISDLSRYTEYPESKLQSFLDGTQLPTLEEIRIISDFLDISSNYLAGTSNYKTFEEEFASLGEIGTLKSILEKIEPDFARHLIECLCSISNDILYYQNSKVDLTPVLEATIYSIQEIRSIIISLYSYSDLYGKEGINEITIRDAQYINATCKLRVYKHSEEIKNLYNKAIDIILNSEYKQL